MPLQIRRGTDAERTAMTQPLAAGELIFVSNTSRLFIGNGTTLGGVPVTDYTDEQARDAAAAMFVSGTHNSITFAYDDALDKVNATVNLSDYQGVIKAAAFNGSVVANDSSLLIDGNTGKFNLSGSVGTDIIPDTDLAYDLGSTTYRFRDLYLSGSSIKLGAATITATGTAVNLPAGSTIGGSAIGIPGGDLNVNIVADDSTVIVNTTTEVVTAQGGFVGNVTGNVNGVVTGTAGSSLVGNVTGNVNGVVTGTAGSTIIGNVNGIVTGSAGSTIIGNVTGNVNGVVTGTAGSSLVGNVTGNVTGNIIGGVTGTAGSSLIGSVTGDTFGFHTGDVKGSVFADDSTNIIDGTSGNITSPFINSTFISAREISLGPDGITGISISTTSNDSVDYDLFTISAFHNGGGSNFGNSTKYLRGRGTNLSPAAVQTSDYLHKITFNAVTSSSTLVKSAEIVAQIDSGAITTTIAPSKIILSTMSTAGALVEGLTLDAASVIGFNANQALTAGASSGQVNTGSVVSYVKIKVGSTAYAIPLYAIRP